jgi:cell division protein FtsB
MNTSEHILVIVLAAALALFLVLAIAAMILVLRLVSSLRAIAQKAEHIVDSAESVSQLFRKTTTPLTLLHFVRSVADAVTGLKRSDKK